MPRDQWPPSGHSLSPPPRNLRERNPDRAFLVFAGYVLGMVTATFILLGLPRLLNG